MEDRIVSVDVIMLVKAGLIIALVGFFGWRELAGVRRVRPSSREPRNRRD